MTDPVNLESENNFHIVSINFIVQILKKKREFTSLRIDCPDGTSGYVDCSVGIKEPEVIRIQDK